MKLYKYFAALLLVVAMCSVVTATAKEKKVKRMYIFGVATSFNDSTAYFPYVCHVQFDEPQQAGEDPAAAEAEVCQEEQPHCEDAWRL